MAGGQFAFGNDTLEGSTWTAHSGPRCLADWSCPDVGGGRRVGSDAVRCRSDGWGRRVVLPSIACRGIERAMSVMFGLSKT